MNSVRQLSIWMLVPSPAAAAGIATFLATLKPPNNPDTLWHLALGKWIAERGCIPNINQFYYTASATPGTDYCWLAQLLLYYADRIPGGTGIVLLNALSAGIIFYVLYKLLEPASSNILLNFTVLALALMPITTYLSCRPVIFTLVFFVLVILILARFVETPPDGQSKLLAPVHLIPLIAMLWANLHPGFILLPVLVVLFLPLCSIAQGRSQLGITLALSLAALLVNPHGWRIYLLPVELLQTLPQLRGLSEWQGVSGWDTLLWGGFVAVSVVGLTRYHQPLPIVFGFACVAILAALSVRNMPLLSIVSVFIWSRTVLAVMTKILERYVWFRRFNLKPGPASGWTWLILLPVSVVTVTASRGFPNTVQFNFAGYPVEAVRYIRAHNCPDNLFVRELWSGYLLWSAPERLLFFDAKGAFSRQAAEDLAELIRPRKNWRNVVTRYNIGTILVEHNTPLAVTLTEADDWHRVYADSLAEVFVHLESGREGAYRPVNAHR